MQKAASGGDGSLGVSGYGGWFNLRDQVVGDCLGFGGGGWRLPQIVSLGTRVFCMGALPMVVVV